MKMSKNKYGLLKGITLVLGVGAILSGSVALTGCKHIKKILFPPHFDRTQLDKYIEAELSSVKAFNPGVSVYLDFSNGMNSAYASPQAQSVMSNVVNKLIGTNAKTEFFSLADNQVTPMGNMSQTEVYNSVMNGGNYSQQEAPIETTLNQIVSKRQQALLVTDFEEYNNGRIQQAAYAKDAFISWLKMGYSIVFYKWDFVENGKPKHLFLTVFDFGLGGLNAEIESAIANAGVGGFVSKYVLGGREFPYAMACNYPKTTQGGNYHDSEGTDVISGTLENGDDMSFYNYATPQANATGTPGNFLPLGTISGHAAQFYPIIVSWTDIVKNIETFKDPQIPEEDRYKHYLGNLYVDFNDQNSFSITGIEARCFNIQAEVDTVSGAKEIEISDMFTAQLLPTQEKGWQEIVVDLDPRFTGEFKENAGNPDDLLRVNVVISGAQPEIGIVDSFFGWPGNSSLSQSVSHTLTSPEVNPQGRVLMSYFIKKI